MRKMHLNFQKITSLPTLIAVLMIVLLSACQKEGVEELETQITTNETTEKITTENLKPEDGETIELKIDPAELKESASSRSATVLKYQNVFSVNAGQWKHLYYPRPSLPDPSVWKVEVSIRPISGDPDLYIYGYDIGAASPWRKVRESIKPGLNIDRTSFRETGMKADEERMYMSVRGYTAATYEITIAWTTVECQEYPSADQWVTLEYNPVCGCDGNEYPNPSSARVAGITSWTVGPCGAGVLDGFWKNVDLNTRGITKMKIKNGARTIHLYGSCSPTDCDWGEETLTYDGSCYRAKYEHGFATRYIKLHLQADGHIKMEIKNDYHDSRPDRTDIHYFK